MDVINKYFRQKADKLSYIDLKNEKAEYQEVGIAGIPLPIILDEMVDGINNKNFNNEIDLIYIVNGILYNIGVDPEFLYIGDYKKILNNLFPNPSEYALSKAIKISERENEKANVFSRAAFLLDERNELAAYNYARVLWTLQDIKEEERHVFVEEAVRILERILAYNEENPLANFELANIFRSTGDYIKADSYLKRVLNFTDNEELKNEARDLMQKIAPDVAVENSIYYINKMNYPRALSELMTARKNSSRYDIPYYIAIAYMNQNQMDMAEKFFEEALDKGADFASLYTDLVYVKYMLKKNFEALNIANEALENYPSEIKLRYNRAIILSSMGQDDKAIEDIDFILEYDDLSDEMFNQLMILKESILEK